MRIINKPKEVVFWVHPRRSGKSELRKEWLKEMGFWDDKPVDEMEIDGED